MAVVLVVDDEVGIRELLAEILTEEGYEVELAENAGCARTAMYRRHPDLVLLDIWMPDNDGISLLKEWSSMEGFNVPVIMMSGHATLDTAIEATKFGAVDFLEKPIALKRLIASVKGALEKSSNEPKIGSAVPHPTPMTRIPPQPTERPQFPARNPINVIDHTQKQRELTDLIDFNAPLREARDQFERAYFLNLLKKENNSIAKVAAFAGLERTHLYRKLKQLGVDISRLKGNGRTDEYSDNSEE